MYVTSIPVQHAVVLRRQILSALDRNEGTPEQFEYAVRELAHEIGGFDADELRMYRGYIAATE